MSEWADPIWAEYGNQNLLAAAISAEAQVSKAGNAFKARFGRPYYQTPGGHDTELGRDLLAAMGAHDRAKAAYLNSIGPAFLTDIHWSRRRA